MGESRDTDFGDQEDDVFLLDVGEDSVTPILCGRTWTVRLASRHFYWNKSTSSSEQCLHKDMVQKILNETNHSN
jgi:hypothetical protein